MMRHDFWIGCGLWLAVTAAMAMLGPPGKHPAVFAAFFLAAHAGMLYLVLRFPRRLEGTRALAVVCLLGVAARLFFLDFPVGNDVYRYVWEGYIQNLGFNPYRSSPDDPVLAGRAGPELSEVWAAVNHKAYGAVYPPAALLLFRLTAAVAATPAAVKALMWAFDLALMGVLAKILRDRALPPSRLLLYAANPLVLVFVAGEAHLDVIQGFFLVGGLALLGRGRHVTGFTAIGLAVMTKYLAAAVLPFIVTRENWKALPAVLLPGLLFLPYIDAGDAVFRSLVAFGTGMHYNDSIAALLRLALAPSTAVFASALVLTGCLACIFLLVQAPERSAYLALAALLVCLPTLHPWYLVLISPFMVLYPSRAWLFLQAAVAVTFPVLGVEYRTGIFQEIHWLKLFEYLPFYGLLLYGLLRPRPWFGGTPFPVPENISVIIPTLNEAGSLEHCLRALRGREALAEVIVADGGSTDATAAIADRFGAQVVVSEKGRGVQIETGLQRARGDLVTILHADCLPARGLFRRMLQVMARRRLAVGGAVGMRFEDDRPKTRWIAGLNNLRTRITGIAFGDQAQFFRRCVPAAIGGFPRMMLMEDVELSLRLKEIGPLVFIPAGIRVSGRRWQGPRFAAKFFTVLRLFFGFLLQRRFRSPERLGRRSYRLYYADR
jgi:rSAM/selenodomain-associated transferase 2